MLNTTRTIAMTITTLIVTTCGSAGHRTTTAVSNIDIPDASSIVFRVSPVRTGDVCEFTTDVALSPPGPDGMVDIPPNHPNIRYFGRIDCSDPLAPAFSYPGISIRTGFTGNSLDIRLRDYAFKRTLATANYYTVVINDGEPTLLETLPGERTYPVARNLPNGTHTIEIFKRSESSKGDDLNVGRGDFLGFRLPAGEALVPVPPRPNRIEFIGDSITCGYGNTVSTDSPEGYLYTSANSDAYNAFGAIAARRLNAEYMAVAYSGRGVIRNYGGFVGRTMPEYYLRTLPDDDTFPPWNPERFTPGVLVINLGTNDYSVGLSPGPEFAAHRTQFKDAYIRFIQQLRQYHPNAIIILAIGPMLSDFYPEGLNAWTSIQEDVSHVLSVFRDNGDNNIHLILFEPQTPPFGADYHPTLETHRKMADGLVRFLKQIDAI